MEPQPNHFPNQFSVSMDFDVDQSMPTAMQHDQEVYGEDDFLMMLDDMGAPSMTGDHVNQSHEEAQVAYMKDPPAYYEEEEDKQSPPQSPIPNEINIFGGNAVPQVTPEQHTNSPLRLPAVNELQLQYKRTLKKLANSMRRSDATRTMVKRQRSATFSVGSALSSDEDLSEDFFCGPKAAEIEQSRRKLMQLIHHES